MLRLSRLGAALHQEVEARPVAWLRMAVGAATLLQLVEVLPLLHRLNDPGVLRIPRFDFLPMPSRGAVTVLAALWVLAGAAFFAGRSPRTAGACLVGIFGYLLLLDQQLFSNHFYLLTILVLLVAAAGGGATPRGSGRGAAPRRIRRPAQERIPALPVDLIKVQVSAVYALAALSKINLIYLSGLVLRYEIRIEGVERLPAPVFAAAAVASICTELFLAAALWSRRHRRLAAAVGVSFHLSILATMQVFPELLTFGLLMVATYPLFFSRSRPRETLPGGTRERPVLQPA